MASKSKKKSCVPAKNPPAEGQPAEEGSPPPRGRDAKGRFTKKDRPAEEDRAPEAPKILPRLATPQAFTDWLKNNIGIDIKLPATAVCHGHSSPWDIFRAIFEDRPQLALVVGGRGTGKTYLSALDTHLTSLKCAGHGTRVLGGSRAQSEQIYRALREFVSLWPEARDPKPVKSLRKGEAVYQNGSEVAILAASSTSVRGPHVPSLKLDEVDEIAAGALRGGDGDVHEPARRAGASVRHDLDLAPRRRPDVAS